MFFFILFSLPSKQIQCSGQRIEYFQKLQVETGITTPLGIPLHSNVRWGSAFNMLDRAYRLRQVSPTPIEVFFLLTHYLSGGQVVRCCCR
jgi:hypothetical protein